MLYDAGHRPGRLSVMVLVFTNAFVEFIGCLLVCRNIWACAEQSF